MKLRYLILTLASLIIVVIGAVGYLWEYPRVSNTQLFACAIGAAIGTFGILWFAPKLQLLWTGDVQSPKDKFDIENEARKTLATIFGASFFLISGYAAWSNLNDTMNKDRAERMTAALEMVESEKRSTSLAGANSLAALTRQYSSPDDYSQAIRVINDVVEQHASIAENASNASEQNGPRPKPAPEVQRLLSFLATRRYPSTSLQDRLSFEDVDLRDASMFKGNWDWATFYGSDFSGANFSQARLQHAQFGPSLMTGKAAALGNVCSETSDGAKDCRPAYLTNADLQQTNFYGTEMQGIQLECADARKAQFINVQLTGANLMCANLQNADLTGADLTGADMTRTLCVSAQQLGKAKASPSEGKLPDFANCPAEWKLEKCNIGKPTCQTN